MEQNERTFGQTRIKNDRLGFIRKVLGILSTQLILTSLFCLFTQLNLFHVQQWLDSTLGAAIQLLSFFGCLVTILALTCNPKLSRRHPTNLILLGIFTFSESILVSSVCLLYEWQSVLCAALLTTAVTLVITIYACTTKNDFTSCTPVLLVFLVSFSLFGMMMALVGVSRYMQIGVACVGVVVYGIYLIVDV